MPNSDEEIRIQITAETAEAIQNAKEIREEMEALKEEMRNASEVGKVALKDLADGLIKAKEAAQELEKINLAEAGTLTGEDTEFFKKQREELSQYKKDVKQALSEITQEENATFTAREQRAKQFGAVRRAEAKERAKEETAQAREAAKAQSEYAKVTQQGFGVMSAAAQDYGTRIQKIKDIIVNTAQSTGQSWDQVAQRMQKFGVSTNDINQALKELNSQTKATTESTKIFGIEVGKLGDVGKFVFGSILGVTGITVLRDIVGWFKEAINSGEEFAGAIFKLGASTRALQKQGLDLTIQDVTERVEKLREEFGIFSRKELVDGIGQIQLYTRQLGFSVEQMDQMTDAVATLAIVMGKDFGETARSVALFLSSGYGEALQRAGIVDANRATVAQELLALGFNKSFNEATQQERALAGLNILLRGTADLSGEVANFQDSMAGKMRLANAEIETQEELIGQKLLPIKLKWKELVVVVIDAYVGLVEAINKVGFAIRFAIQAPIEGIIKIYEQLRDGTFEIINLNQTLADSFEETGKKLREAFLIDFFDLEKTYEDLGKDIAKGFSKGFEDGLDIDISDELKEIADEIEKEAERLQNRLGAIARDVANDLERISRDTLNDIVDIGRDLAQKLADIATQLEQKIQDAIRRAALQREQIIRAANLRRADINRKYQERELKAERDYQEALRRLREDFLLDLEDALRERDALQVLRLTKKYNLEQDRLKRERDNEREDLERQRKQELEDLERQTQERLRILQEELQARIEALQIAAQREREQAILEAQRKIEEERIQEERRKEERKIREQEQIEEEKKRAQERLEAYAEELAEREGLTQEALDTLIKALEDNYGEGGLVQGVISGLEQALIEANAAVAASVEEMARRIKQAIAQIHALNYPNNTPNNPPSPPLPRQKFQEGGTLIANKPTTALFGEVPELVQFTPLNRIGRNEGKVFGGNLPNLGGRGNGKLALDIMLSKGLEAQIVESALNEVADVIVNVQRKR